MEEVGYILLTGAITDTEVWVKANKIIAMHQSSSHTKVRLGDDAVYKVKESPEEIQDRIREFVHPSMR